MLQIYISQGTVVTQLRCDGLLSNHFIANFPQNLPVENVENRLIFGKDTYKSLRLTVFFLRLPSSACLEWYHGMACRYTGAVMRELTGHYTIDHRSQLARQWDKCVKHCLEWDSS